MLKARTGATLPEAKIFSLTALLLAFMYKTLVFWQIILAVFLQINDK